MPSEPYLGPTPAVVVSRFIAESPSVRDAVTDRRVRWATETYEPRREQGGTPGTPDEFHLLVDCYADDQRVSTHGVTISIGEVCRLLDSTCVWDVDEPSALPRPNA